MNVLGSPCLYKGTSCIGQVVLSEHLCRALYYFPLTSLVSIFHWPPLSLHCEDYPVDNVCACWQSIVTHTNHVSS